MFGSLSPCRGIGVGVAGQYGGSGGVMAAGDPAGYLDEAFVVVAGIPA
jgi:hypothetical protein